MDWGEIMSDAISGILQRHQLDIIDFVGVTINRETLDNHRNLIERIAAFAEKSAEGWLCLTDRVISVDRDFDLEAISDKIILCAEIAHSNQSLHVRQEGSQWALHTITREDSDEMIVVSESFISKDRPAILNYETFWREVPDSGGHRIFLPYVSRFVGFEKASG